jgi:hypothetical protein
MGLSAHPSRLAVPYSGFGRSFVIRISSFVIPVEIRVIGTRSSGPQAQK